MPADTRIFKIISRKEWHAIQDERSKKTEDAERKTQFNNRKRHYPNSPKLTKTHYSFAKFNSIKPIFLKPDYRTCK